MGKELNIKKALNVIEKEIKKNWKQLDFTFAIENGGKTLKATADITIQGFDDSIFVIFDLYAGGGFECRAVYDKIEKTAEVLDLLNEFNGGTLFFKAFARNDGFLELSNFTICYDVAKAGEYVSECLFRLIDLDENEAMHKLANLTTRDE